jgi:hypothetical protein
MSGRILTASCTAGIGVRTHICETIESGATAAPALPFARFYRVQRMLLCLLMVVMHLPFP